MQGSGQRYLGQEEELALAVGIHHKLLPAGAQGGVRGPQHHVAAAIQQARGHGQAHALADLHVQNGQGSRAAAPPLQHLAQLRIPAPLVMRYNLFTSQNCVGGLLLNTLSLLSLLGICLYYIVCCKDAKEARTCVACF